MTSSLLPLLLASASPRRQQLIAMLNLPFTISVAVAPADEEAAQERYRGPSEGLAVWTAKYKLAAAHALPEAGDRLVIAADTTVLLGPTILGKPRNKAHARVLLLALRGRIHHVITGIAISAPVNGTRIMRSASCITPVRMRNYSEAEIDAYIATGDPMDKAGAYGIQHPQFQPTQSINGCYYNVVGLPLCTLVDLLAEFNVWPVIKELPTTACPWSGRCEVE